MKEKSSAAVERLRPGKAAAFAALFFALVGFAGSAYLFKTHVLDAGKDVDSFCDVNAVLNCDIVNNSPWGKLFGVPTSGIGLAYYGLLLALLAFARWGARPPAAFFAALFAYVLGGWIYAMFLTYIEAAVLQAWCIVCVSSAISITMILIVSAAAFGLRLPGALAAGWKERKS